MGCQKAAIHWQGCEYRGTSPPGKPFAAVMDFVLGFDMLCCLILVLLFGYRPAGF